jgi:hypothetical protein
VLDHFQTHGWVRVPSACSSDAAAAMREVLWRALAEVGIDRSDPSTLRPPLGDRPVLENTARAGDVIVVHPLLPHEPPAAHANKDLWL